MLDIELKAISLGDGEDSSCAWVALAKENVLAKP